MKTKWIISLALVCIPAGVSAQVVLTLDDCMALASDSSSEVLNAELDVSYAELKKSEAFTYYFPSVKATVLGFHFAEPLITVSAGDLLGTSPVAADIAWYFDAIAKMFGLNTSYSLLRNGYSANLSLMQPLYAGGKIVNANRLASLGVRASQLKRSMTERDILDKVESRYWQVVVLEEKMELLSAALTMLDSLRKDVSSAFQAGLAVEADMLALRNEITSLKAQQTKLRAGIRMAKMDLFNSIGVEYSFVGGAYAPDIDDIRLADGLEEGLASPLTYYRDPSSVFMNMEEAQLLELSVRQHEIQKRMALSEALPQVGVGASGGYGRVVGDPKWNGAVFATVSIPLSDWGKTAFKMKQSELLRQKAINDRDYLQRQLVLQLRQYWEEVISAWDELEIAKENVSLKELLETQAAADFRAGIVTMTQLMKAQTDLLESRTSLTDAYATYRAAVAKYLRRL